MHKVLRITTIKKIRIVIVNVTVCCFLLLQSCSPKNFEWVSPYKNNKAIAIQDGQSILIDQDGKKLIDYPYEDNYPIFCGEFMIVSKGTTCNVIDTEGNEILESGYSHLRSICDDCNYLEANKKGQDGVLDLNNMKFYPVKDIAVTIRATQQDQLLIRNKKNHTTDLVSLDGTIIKNIPYRSVKQLANGNFMANSYGKAILLDSLCEEPISQTYDKLRESDNKDYIFTTKDNKQGLIDNTGLELFIPRYDKFYEYNGHYFTRDSSSSNLLDKELNLLSQFNESCSSNYFNPPYFVCVTDSNSLVLNIESQQQRKFPYKIFYSTGFIDQYFYEDGDKMAPLNNDFSIDSSGVIRKVFGMEVIDFGIGKAIRLPDGSKMNNQSYSTVRSLLANNKLVLGNIKTRKVGLFSRDGEEILPMEYEEIKHLNRNYLTIKKGNLIGIAKPNGEILVEPRYGRIRYYSGIYIVKYSGYTTKEFLLDENFSPIDLGDYHVLEQAQYHRNLLLIGSSTSQALYDINTRSILKRADEIELLPTVHYVQLKQDGLFGNMDLRDLSMIVPFQPEKYHKIKIVPKFSKVYYEIGAKKEHQRGIVSLDGEELIPIGYGATKWFGEYIRRICIEKDGKVGVINFEKEVIIPFIYDDIEKFSRGQSVVRIGKKFGLIDEEGEAITPVIYSRISLMYGGLRLVEKGENRWNSKKGFLDKDGKVVISAKYDYANFFEGGLSVIGNEGSYGVINIKDELIIPIIYDEIEFRSNGNQFFVSLEGNKFIIDLDGFCIKDCPDEEILLKYMIEKK